MMPYEMPTKKAEPSPTPFSLWFQSATEAADLSLAEIGRRVESDYNYMQRLRSGVRKRPSYKLAKAIGAVLGDVPGALAAAGYEDQPLPSGYERVVLGDWNGLPIYVQVPQGLGSEERQEMIRAAHEALNKKHSPPDTSGGMTIQ